MARGFGSGALTGVIVVGLGAGAASVLTGPVMAPQPDVPVQDAQTRLTPEAPQADALPSRTPEAPRGNAETASPGVPEQTGTGAAGPQVDVGTAPRPDPVATTDAPVAPTVPQDGGVALTAEAPVLPNPQAPQPDVPQSESLAIATAPAQPPEAVPAPTTAPAAAPETPQVAGAATGETDATGNVTRPTSQAQANEAVDTSQEDAGTADADTSGTAMIQEDPDTARDPRGAGTADTAAQAREAREAEASAQAEAQAEAPTSATVAADAETVDTDRAAKAATQDTAAAAEDGAEAADAANAAEGVPSREDAAGEIMAQADAPAAPRAPLPRIGDDATPTPDAAVDAAPQSEGVAGDADATEGTGAEPPAGPSIGAGASDLTRLAPGIATNRLPSVGGEASAAEAQPPLQAFAEPVALDDDRPLMSIVLIDDGSTPLGLEALASFPYPLTFAVDAEWEGAGAAMERYRAAGFEVMVLANLPEGARPSDAAVTLSAALDAVPEAVAVLEGDAGGVQGSRDVTDQVSASLAQSGHGLILYPQGLNTAISLAERAGVPARALFRDFDGAGQDATVIRRFLDQAAFKAGQEGAVVMVGRLRAETISALLIWGLQDRASRVSFVPISQVLVPDPS